MHLSEIHVEGFKSYAQRTVIAGWDPQFNAITGLNGSGKSNILDAICFVLGISNLSQVRASNLQDLVYKQGQAGINKATVTLVFNNSVAKDSPIGYEQHDLISVTRQIIIGGRNKYMINGTTAQPSSVHNLFQSVGLNVNNPHFLIMQGRITKVLNMKPKETLGLIEEAAGTRMFETKKDAAVKTIEKKQEKVNEITSLLIDEITPTLDRLQKDKTNYLKWASNNTESERYNRLVIAWEYTQAASLRTGSAEAIAKLQAQVSATLQAATDHRTSADAKLKEISAQDAKLAAARGGEHASMAEAVDVLNREVARAEAAHSTRTRECKAEESSWDAAVMAAKEGEAQRAALAASQAKAKVEAESAKADAVRLADLLKSLQSKLTAVSAGMSGEGDGTVAEQLILAKKRVTQLTAEISQREMTAKHARSKAKDLSAALKHAEKESSATALALEKSAKALEQKKGALAAVGFDVRRNEALSTERERLYAEVTKAESIFESESSGLSALTTFQYDRRGMGAGWDAAKRVRGTVAQLVKLARKEAAVALEIVAGGKMGHVVCDTDETGKLLLEKGNLPRRVTMVPLSTIRGRAPTPAQVQLAASLTGGKAFPALSCVAPSDPAYAKVLEYVFDTAFVCVDDEAAKKVAYGEGLRCKAVTLAGDVFDPAGTMEGGSAPNGGGTPLLVRLDGVSELGNRLAKAKASLAECDAALATMAKAAKAHADASEEVEIAQHGLTLTEQRMNASSLGTTRAGLASVTKQAEDDEAAAAAAKTELKDGQAKVKGLESEIKNESAAREGRVAAVEKEIKETSKAASVADEKSRKMMAQADAAGFELEGAAKATAKEAEAIAERSAVVSKLKEEVASLSTALVAVKSKQGEAKAKLSAAQEAIAAADKARQKLVKEKEKELEAAMDKESEVKLLDAEVKKTSAAAVVAEKTCADLMVRWPFIAVDRATFGEAHSDYDFKRNDPKVAASKLSALAKQTVELEKKINKKVMGMIETAEREYAELKRKRDIIENDKAKINKVIAELDEKKNEALRTTWAKVNKDFGSIFSTLLPDTTAKLEPLEGGTVLDGLEVRVAFNGVWKASLSELSGGQRSLLALSLILAMLLFKPAPMYILDEVDAALDMSHTQNIGVMIRRFFYQSQFIVVSLKQGMFSNANVIFRTKFVDGTSTVTRTVPGSSELLARGAIGDVENAGPAGKGKVKAGRKQIVDAEEENEEEEEGGRPAAKKPSVPLTARTAAAQ